MIESENKYVVQLTTENAQSYWMRDKELTSRVSTLEDITYGHNGEFSEKTTNITGIAALPENSESVDSGEIKLIVADGEQAAAYDSEGNIWIRTINGDDVTWTNKWDNKLDKPGNNDSYVLTSVYTAAQIGEPPETTEENLWDLIMELQERIRLLEAKQQTLTGVNFDVDADTTGYKLILILGDNTAFDDGTGIEIADKVEQALQENNVGIIWIRNDSSIDLYKYLSSYYTAYQASGEPAADAKPAILINSDNEEMFISSAVRNNFDGNFIALSDFALIIFIANGGDLDNANRYGASSGNYSYIGGAINPNTVKINVSESQEMQVRVNKPAGATNTWGQDIQEAPNYVPNSYSSEGNYAYIKVQVPTTVTSSVNTVYAMEASVLKLVQTAAPDSVIRVVNPITWNINGNTDTSSAYQSAKTTLLSGLKSFCTNYGYVFKEIYSINDNNRKSTMDLASKTVTSTAAINNYIKNLCSLINEALSLTTIVVSSSNGNKSGELARRQENVALSDSTNRFTFPLSTDSKNFTIMASGNYNIITTYTTLFTANKDNLVHLPKFELQVYKNDISIYHQSLSNSNGTLTCELAGCVVGDKIKYVVKSQGQVKTTQESPTVSGATVTERYKWQVEVVTADSENNS